MTKTDNATTMMEFQSHPGPQSLSKSVGVFDQLSWRMCPSVSYSDWTIEIVRIGGEGSSSSNNNNHESSLPESVKFESSASLAASESSQQSKNTQTLDEPPQQRRIDRYHVHRSVLAVGPRHSEYFAAQFQLKMSENVTFTSRIEMDDNSRADVFPLLLDFMYSQEDLHSESTRLPLTADKAAGLHNLAEYFDMPQLRDMAEDYYSKHLTMKNLVEFIIAAQRHHAPCLMEIAVEKSVEKLLDMDPKTARQLEPSFLLQILEANQALGERLYGFHASQLVAECGLGEHRDKLTKTLFYQLTDKGLLPYMESKAAVHLLSLDAMFAVQESDEERGDPQHVLPAVHTSSSTLLVQQPIMELTCLQKRCTQSITDKWKHIRSQAAANGELSQALAQVPSHVLVDMLMKATSEVGLREYELEEKESPRDNPPRILVHGAGTPDANGIYSRDGLFQGVCMYNRPGEYNGTSCLFSMFQCLVGSKTKRWFISVIPSNGRPGTNDDIDFFSALVTDECMTVPPKRGWRKSSDGADPPPTLLF